MPSRPAPVVSEHVARLVPYSPGTPIEQVKRELGLSDVVKMASNENPLGPSRLAVAAVREAANTLNLYPHGDCPALREALAARHNVPPDWLIFGNGSDDLIHLLGVTYLEPGDEVIQAHPSFSRYEAAAYLHNAPCHLAPLRDWRIDLHAVADRLDEHTRLVFIANPNNPTSTAVTAPEVDGLLEAVSDRTLVVLDEAYIEFVDDPHFPDSIGLVRRGENVVALRTFSKVYGLAGLRVGYGIARPEIVADLERVREPFNVNSLAQAGALAALSDTEHLRRTVENNREGKRQLTEGLEALGYACAPSQANFVWFDVRRPSRDVYQALLRSGIIVRAGAAFGADTCLRVTIGTPTENARLLTALEELGQLNSTSAGPSE